MHVVLGCAYKIKLELMHSDKRFWKFWWKWKCSHWN